MKNQSKPKLIKISSDKTITEMNYLNNLRNQFGEFNKNDWIKKYINGTPIIIDIKEKLGKEKINNINKFKLYCQNMRHLKTKWKNIENFN